jgi:hypothetical protein
MTREASKADPKRPANSYRYKSQKSGSNARQRMFGKFPNSVIRRPVLSRWRGSYVGPEPSFPVREAPPLATQPGRLRTAAPLNPKNPTTIEFIRPARLTRRRRSPRAWR